MAEAGKQPIIKKVIKKSGGGHHGGSWKVAYADFVTAMMAFFLLMWLLSMTEPEKKMQLAQYFKDFTVFSQEGAGMMQKDFEKMSDIQTTYKPKTSYLPQVGGGGGKEEPKDKVVIPTNETIESMSPFKTFKKNIKTKMAMYKRHINVVQTEEGIKIDIMSLEDEPLFQIGKKEITETMKKILAKLNADILQYVDNKIAIEGHTDAIYFANDKQTNWELSTDRASEVRRELEKMGFNSDRLLSVTGYASTKPLIKENPKDTRNRRISFLIYDPSAAKKEVSETKVVRIES